MTIRHQAYMDQVKGLNRQVWDGIHTLLAMQAEWNALDYGSTMEAGSGTNEGITPAEVGAVVFDSANALKAVLNAGHATNMAKLL
jgi:hypothetical protein